MRLRTLIGVTVCGALLAWSAFAGEVKAPSLAQPSVSIVSPGEKQTVHDNTGRVPVSVKVQNNGSLPEGHSVWVVLDGERVGRVRDTHSFQLESVVRGEHRLQVELVDESGKVVASSEPVTFYLWQSSRLF